jgi:uncharacterized protein YdbL (DUF1318 family)
MTHAHSQRIRAAFAGALLLVFGAAAPAAALDLDQARAAGQVGERPDGLVGAVSPDANAEVRGLVETINRARLDAYRALAQKEGTPLEAVQAVAGERQTQAATRNGWYVMDAGGRWRKP